MTVGLTLGLCHTDVKKVLGQRWDLPGYTLLLSNTTTQVINPVAMNNPSDDALLLGQGIAVRTAKVMPEIPGGKSVVKSYTFTCEGFRHSRAFCK